MPQWEPEAFRLVELPPDQANVILKTKEFVERTLAEDHSGHDWSHVCRVWRMAEKIGVAERADMYVVRLSALLHDIADWKWHNGDFDAGSRVARSWLEGLNVPENVASHVARIVGQVSFRGASVRTTGMTVEACVVQDADRLDAIGAVGIARVFAYGGSRGREIYAADVPPVMHDSAHSYVTTPTTSINHFFEKLLLVKDGLNTQTARDIAADRQVFMERFLARFFDELGGID